MPKQNDPGFLSNPENSSSSSTSWLPFVYAGAVVMVALAALLFFTGRRHTASQTGGATLAAAHPYAASLPITNVQMSEASNFAGGKVTYIDGEIANTGSKTVTGIVVQMAFHNDLNVNFAFNKTLGNSVYLIIHFFS